MPKIDIKGANLESFRRKPAAYKAHKLFADYGTDLPDDVIEFLRDESRKSFEKYRIDNPIREDADVLTDCHNAIQHWNWPAEVAYETFAEELGISSEAMRRRYRRAFYKKEK